MTRRTRRIRSNKLPPFVALTWEILNSTAYNSMNYSAAKALPYFLGKYKGPYHDTARYTFEFPFSYAEANRYEFPSATFSKVIQELVRKGFIDPVDKGGLRSDGKSYNFFKLSRRWEQYGTPDFKPIEWRCFMPKVRLKATSKNEMDSFEKGNKPASEGMNISQIEAVAGISS